MFFKKITSQNWAIWGAAVLGILVYWSKYSFALLDVQNVSWFLARNSDRASDFSMWQFYRVTPFDFPFGKITGYAYPSQTGVGGCGSTALLALPLKLISRWLPLHFQFFGWWLLVCYVLQGVFAVRLLQIWGIKNNFLLLLCAAFLCISPVMLTRTDHINLTAHWLILGGLCAYFDFQKTLRQRFWLHFGFCVMAALIHPYMVLFNLGLASATLLDEFFKKKNIRLSQFLGGLGGLLSGVLLAWWVSGGFVMKASSSEMTGFAKYSANLNTLFNSENQCRLPRLPHAFTEQYEGFGYLGFGIIVLLPIAAFFYFLGKKETLTKHLFLALVTILLTLFALSTTFTFNEHVLADFGYKPIRILADTFRSSGRYIWLIHYLLVFSILYIIIKKFEEKKIITILILVTAFVIQAYDIYPMYQRIIKDVYNYEDALSFDIWRQATQEAQRLVMYPPYAGKYKTTADYVYFAELAYEQKIGITAGYMPRYDEQLKNSYAQSLTTALAKGEIPKNETNSLFISSLNNIDYLKPMEKNGQIRLFQLDGYAVGVPTALAETTRYFRQLGTDYQVDMKIENLHEFLERQSDKTVLISVRDEATEQLCDAAKKYLTNAGATTEQLALRGSYCAILHHGKIIAERLDNKKSVELSWSENEKIGNFVIKKSLFLYSAGGEVGNRSEMVIAGKNYSPNERGFNLIVIDNNFNISEIANFDTYLTCMRAVKPKK